MACLIPCLVLEELLFGFVQVFLKSYFVGAFPFNAVWVSDWGANAILRFDPRTEKFESVPLPDQYASVRQLAGRKGEVWGAESAADKIFVLKAE